MIRNERDSEKSWENGNNKRWIYHNLVLCVNGGENLRINLEKLWFYMKTISTSLTHNAEALVRIIQFIISLLSIIFSRVGRASFLLIVLSYQI